VILLDTHAIIWIAHGHRRVRRLLQLPRLYISPASVLEIQFLMEAGRVRLVGDQSPQKVAGDRRWQLDEPPAGKWFSAACDIGWTRDPFDRLLAAHAKSRGWKLATADTLLLDHLGASDVMAL
jgi:PIN domain nuclease of toxin-antitoxin system